tara:strand:+ start:2635 stop:4161 length:1527 start_codon:yes stop_codon:yes gene_type:complete
MVVGVLMSVFSTLSGSRSVREFCARRFGLVGSYGHEMTQQACRDIEIRIRARQLALVDRAARSIFANVAAALIVAYIVRHNVGIWPLALWVCTLTLLALMLHACVARHERNYDQTRTDLSLTMCYLREHTIIATFIGLTWGLFLLYSAPMLSDWHVILLGLTILGCVSASASGLGGYLPAYFGYYFGALIPVVFVILHTQLGHLDNLGTLISIYAIVVGGNVVSLNRGIIETLRLRAENERLANTVAVAEAATAAAMRSKWEGFAHLSHELRTPMNAVLGFSDMMRMEMFGPLSLRYREYSECVHASGRSALSLIDSLLEMSRVRTGDLSLDEAPFDPVILLRDVADAFERNAATGDVSLNMRARPVPYAVLGDRAKIRQVLHAILSNAIKFTEPGGTVSLDLLSGDEGICMTVTDTGIGIAHDDIAKCQEPFVRLGDPLLTGTGGAGLGLPIARHLLEAHGGSLSMQSRLGVGTTVTILLPLDRRVSGVDAYAPQPVAANARALRLV